MLCSTIIYNLTNESKYSNDNNKIIMQNKTKFIKERSKQSNVFPFTPHDVILVGISERDPQTMTYFQHFFHTSRLFSIMTNAIFMYSKTCLAKGRYVTVCSLSKQRMLYVQPNCFHLYKSTDIHHIILVYMVK